MKKRISIIMASFIFIILIAVAFTVLQQGYNKVEEQKINTGNLPTVGTKEKLLSLLEKSKIYNGGYNMEDKGILAAPEQATTNGAPQYSTTNTQVQGVDEADLVKTDGKYIYSISERKLIITEATPATNMKITATLFEDEKVTPTEMMIDDKYLTVMCNNNVYYPYAADFKTSMIAPDYMSNTSSVYVFDISDKNNVTKVKTVEIDGGYLTSRKVDNSVYVITNKYVWNNQNEDIRPVYSIDGTKKIVDYNEICYFPGTSYTGYTMIGIIDLSNLSKEVKVNTYLTSAQNVYMSLDNLYITAINGYENTPFMINGDYTTTTSIYKFNINNSNTDFIARAELKGTTLNQFSMDEYKGYLRVTLNNNEDNSLYVLDGKMNIVGKIAGIAKGEKIYSTRFIKDRAYLVTFKTVDPLFVIDLKNPANPNILGELKIPGYSSYLHEYDENHIIGIGQDTTEVYDKDAAGNIINTRYVINGMKMAIFDVTDVNKPIQQFSTKLGDRSTYSDVLYNHKAFLFSKDKNLLAIPVDIYKDNVSIQTNLSRDEGISYSQSNHFQGLLVYNIDLEKGFTEKGRITHYDSEKVESKYPYYEYNYLNNIKRGLFIGDTLYTVSENKIKANDLNTLKDIYTLNLK